MQLKHLGFAWLDALAGVPLASLPLVSLPAQVSLAAAVLPQAPVDRAHPVHFALHIAMFEFHLASPALAARVGPCLQDLALPSLKFKAQGSGPCAGQQECRGAGVCAGLRSLHSVHRARTAAEQPLPVDLAMSVLRLDWTANGQVLNPKFEDETERSFPPLDTHIRPRTQNKTKLANQWWPGGADTISEANEEPAREIPLHFNHFAIEISPKECTHIS